MRFNRNGFVATNNLVPDQTVAPKPDPSVAPTQPAPTTVVSTPAAVAPTPAPKPAFDAASRLAELRAEAMRSVNKTVMSQAGITAVRKPVSHLSSSNAVVCPTYREAVHNTTPSPAPKSAPKSEIIDPEMPWIVRTTTKATATKPTLPKPTPTKSVSNDLDLESFAQDIAKVSNTSGLSLSSSPLPRRQPAPVYKKPAFHTLPKPSPSVSQAPAHRLQAKMVAKPVLQPAQKPVSHLSSSNAVVQNTTSSTPSLTDLIKNISDTDDLPKKDAKSVVRNAKAKNRHGKISKKQKIIGAMAATAAVLGVLGYVGYLSVPDFSARILASQAGIDVHYPSEIIKGYAMQDASVMTDGKVSITYSDSSSKYVITEQKSSWDSEALLNNYVMPNWGSTYSTIREKGLTIYISNYRASWVSGGLQYFIDATNAKLTNEQLRAIAISM
jgi:hypothetical protein